MIILDTNVLSELMRQAPAAAVVSWSAAQPTQTLYVTSITKAEILHGVLLLPTGRRQRKFEHAAQSMFREEFSGRVLSFDGDAALSYAQIAVARRRAGRPISHFDAQIAAIARSVRATVATRNVSDFEGCEIRLVNPWEWRPQ